MSTRNADVVIVGGGVEGTSIAYALAQRAVGQVTLLERSMVGSGSTSKSSSLVRCHYGIPVLAMMAWEGVSFFENARELLGDDLGFRQVGYLLGVGWDNIGNLQSNMATLQTLGIATELVEGQDVKAWWPEAALSDFAGFAYEPRGGYGDAYRTAQGFARRAKQMGASVFQHDEVLRILLSPDGSTVLGVEDTHGLVESRTVIVAAGPWSVPLLADAGLTLPIRAQREGIVIIDPGTPVNERPVLSDLVNLQYLRPESSGHLLVGNTDLSRPEYVDADTFPDRVDDDQLIVTGNKLARGFPGFQDARVVTTYAGCYDVTPDYNPIIGESGIAGLLLCAGFSGHGFKISPAVGELVADILCKSESPQRESQVAALRFERFDERRPLISEHPYVRAGEMH